MCFVDRDSTCTGESIGNTILGLLKEGVLMPELRLLVADVGRIWLDALVLEVLDHLARNFFEDISCKPLGVIVEISKRNELNDVPVGTLTGAAFKRFLVGVKLLHRREVSLADTHNNDRERQVRSLDDPVDCGCKVCNCAISEDQENVVALIALRLLLHLGVTVLRNLINNW